MASWILKKSWVENQSWIFSESARTSVSLPRDTSENVVPDDDEVTSLNA